MKEAPASVLHALFDAAMAVDAAVITVFEHHQDSDGVIPLISVHLDAEDRRRAA